MKLLVVSNHHPTEWSEEQKRGWDEIRFVPFPNVPANADEFVVSKIADELAFNIGQLTADWSEDEFAVNLQGEYTLCNILFRALNVRWAFPTTERRVVEETRDGKTIKNVVFEFVRWRIL